MNKKAWLDPTPEMLESEEFDAIWQVIKTWDVNVPEAYDLYCNANGNHVRAILDGLNLMTFTKKKEIHSLESKLLSLKSVTKTQSTKGNYDANEYMRGLANGLIMAEAIMDDKEPKYFEANYPEKNREEKYPVIPQKILKLNWDEGNVRTGIGLDVKTLQEKIDEIIDVINDMKGVK